MKIVKSAQIQLIVACVTLALLSGCTEDPNDKAARQFQDKTTKTLDEYARNRDSKSAGEQLNNALPSGRVGSLSENAALLTATDMQLAQAQRDWASLQAQTPQISKTIDHLNMTLEQMSGCLAQSQRIRSLLDLSDAEIDEIKSWIGSDPNTESLKGQLAQSLAQEKDLLAKKAGLEQDFKQARDTMLSLDAQSEEKLRQAKTAGTDKQAQLEEAGFDLKSQKKEYYLKAQHAENALAEVDSDLSIIQPRIKRLQNNLQQAEEKLTGLKTSTSRSDLLLQQQDLTAEINQQKAAIKTDIDRITAQLTEYGTKSDEIISFVNQLIEKYQKINDRQLEPNTSMSAAQAFALAGDITVAKVYLPSDLGLRLEAVLRTYETVLPEALTTTVTSKPDVETAKKAIELFDKTVESYQQAADNAGQLRDGSQKAALAALKGQLIAVNDKIQIADRIGDFETAEKTQAQMDSLMEKGKEYGSAFSQSTTVLLLTKGTDYIPTLPVDASMAIEGIKKDFAEWRKLRGTAAETEVERLMKQIDQLRKDYPGDDQITQFLDQEQQAMEQAKTKGFTEEAAAPADANSTGM